MNDSKKIKITCPHCAKSINATEKHIGKTVKCPACNAAFVVTPNEIAILTQPIEPPPVVARTVAPVQEKKSRLALYLSLGLLAILATPCVSCAIFVSKATKEISEYEKEHPEEVEQRKNTPSRRVAMRDWIRDANKRFGTDIFSKFEPSGNDYVVTATEIFEVQDDATQRKVCGIILDNWKKCGGDRLVVKDWRGKTIITMD